MTNNPDAVQQFFRFRSDTEAFSAGTPTWIDDEDVNITWDTDTTFRIRFQISNIGNANFGSTDDWAVYLSKGGGSYTKITTTSSDVILDSAASTDTGDNEIATAQFHLTAGTGTANNGFASDDQDPADNIAKGTYSEGEFGFSVVDADVTDADTLDFRVYVDQGSGFASFEDGASGGYDITPRLTVNKPVAGSSRSFGTVIG